MPAETDSLGWKARAGDQWTQKYDEYTDLCTVNTFADTLISYATMWYQSAARNEEDVFQPHPKKMSSSTSYANILRNQAPLHRIDTGTPRWRNQVVQPQELDHHLTQEVTQEAPRQYRSSNVQRETLMYSPTAPVQRKMQRCTETSLQRTSSRRGQETMWEHNKRNHDSTSSPNFDDGYEGYWRDSRFSDGGKPTNQVSSTNHRLVTHPQRGWAHHPTPHHGPTTISTPTTTHQHTDRKMGCYDCGEFNHRRSTCRVSLGGFKKHDHITPAFKELGWLKIKPKPILDVNMAMYRSVNNLNPKWLHSFPTVHSKTNSVTRQQNNLIIPSTKTDTPWC
ncbi:hypothetical protein Pmani_006757 [Petrolisthes manimaculis]|uniref:Uncharacterized protein n=1 Tax=Petrolisthes manimaculis TaxID=1843537 RepID=A0AAE1QBS9_9EUCA|nr:hypothetical protein Pmani_006757 [Petrolisthes manimaculis]